LLLKESIISQTKKHVIEQSRKALYCLYRKNKNLDLPIDCQLKLFDNTDFLKRSKTKHATRYVIW